MPRPRRHDRNDFMVRETCGLISFTVLAFSDTQWGRDLRVPRSGVTYRCPPQIGPLMMTGCKAATN